MSTPIRQQSKEPTPPASAFKSSGLARAKSSQTRGGYIGVSLRMTPSAFVLTSFQYNRRCSHLLYALLRHYFNDFSLQLISTHQILIYRAWAATVVLTLKLLLATISLTSGNGLPFAIAALPRCGPRLPPCRSSGYVRHFSLCEQRRIAQSLFVWR